MNPGLDHLDGQHTIFGEVVKGFDVLEKLNEWICDKEGRPYQDVRIMHTVILDDPFEDFSALSEQNRCESPEPTDERLQVIFSIFLLFNYLYFSLFSNRVIVFELTRMLRILMVSLPKN